MVILGGSTEFPIRLKMKPRPRSRRRAAKPFEPGIMSTADDRADLAEIAKRAALAREVIEMRESDLRAAIAEFIADACDSAVAQLLAAVESKR